MDAKRLVLAGRTALTPASGVYHPPRQHLFTSSCRGCVQRAGALAAPQPQHIGITLTQKRDSLHRNRDHPLARACGIVTVRQQPGTASGTVFVTLEDETGTVNVIVWPALKERQRRELVHARLLAVYGVWQREGEVRHLIAHRLRDLSPLLGRLHPASRNFR